jgi:hypothetical protein
VDKKYEGGPLSVAPDHKDAGVHVTPHQKASPGEEGLNKQVNKRIYHEGVSQAPSQSP